MDEIVIADLSLPAHAEAVVFLLNEYAKDEMGGQSELSQFVKDNLAKTLRQQAGAHVILAFKSSKPVGLLICLEGFSTFACKPLLNIHDLAVLAEYRGQGIAKRLLLRAEKIAIEKGCCKLTLEVLQGNVKAQAVYRSCGYGGYALKPEMGSAMYWQKKI